LTRSDARTIKPREQEVSMEPTRASRGTRSWIAVSIAASLLLGASATRADEYDPQRAGHPVRIIAYVVHPVGVVLDLLIFRPAHWVGSLPVLDKFFGHEPYDD
jgi:hypothetical protein